jgi:hypothetical protein
MSARGWATRSVDAELDKKGRSYERNRTFLRSADCVVHDRAGRLEPQEELAGHGLWLAENWITKNVPALWIDYISAETLLPGMWQAFYSGCVLDFKKMNRLGA